MARTDFKIGRVIFLLKIIFFLSKYAIIFII